MKEFKTEQERFWSGEFGNEYIDRNQSNQLLAANLKFFSTALKRANKFNSCIEFGANIGMNLNALQLLYPPPVCDFWGIEINGKAVSVLNELLGKNNVYHSSILDFQPTRTWELVFTKVVLIHINPTELPTVYEKLVSSTNRYLLICEYYDPNPCEVEYRGHKGKLFKRDFAGEIMDLYPSMKLIDFGCTYRRDHNYSDDVNWFLLEKHNPK